MTSTERRGPDRRHGARGGRRASDLPGQYPLVLIADSDDGARNVCVRYLHQFGFQVAEARTGGEAAAALDTSRPHVAITELAVASASRFRAGLTKDSRIPVIVMTTDEAAKVPPDSAGVLVKPFALAMLLHEVRRVLTLRATESGEARDEGRAGALDPRDPSDSSPHSLRCSAARDRCPSPSK
jgi:DNA-binding response OmpR family regulator